MKLLIHDIKIFPFDDDKHKIIGIGGDPEIDLDNGIYAIEVPYYVGGYRKCDVYWDTFEQRPIEWTPAEQLDNYKVKVKLDMENKSFEYTSRLDYRIRYYNDYVERGGVLTTAQQNDKIEKQNLSIQAKNYIHDRVVIINTATTKEDIDKEYDDFIVKYDKKIQELENVL